MKFQKYSSLENAHRQKFIDQCEELGVRDWIALEKVHGSNFSFIAENHYKEGVSVTPAKRSSTIGKNAAGRYEFYNCHDVVEMYKGAVVELSEFFESSLQIYGELYGEGVQKEIDYGPKDFVAFDIMLHDGKFLPHETVEIACSRVGIPVVPEIARGTLDEMLNVEREFNSVIASGDSQVAEGLVIKPLTQDVYLNNGSRAIIKNKSQKFSEKKNKAHKKPFKLPDNVTPIFEHFVTYLNANRLNNVLSKVGCVSQKDFGKVTGMLVQDAKEEFERDEYEIDKDDWELMAKSVGREASTVIRADWLNILDNQTE